MKRCVSGRSSPASGSASRLRQVVQVHAGRRRHRPRFDEDHHDGMRDRVVDDLRGHAAAHVAEAEHARRERFEHSRRRIQVFGLPSDEEGGSTSRHLGDSRQNGAVDHPNAVGEQRSRRRHMSAGLTVLVSTMSVPGRRSASRAPHHARGDLGRRQRQDHSGRLREQGQIVNDGYPVAARGVGPARRVDVEAEHREPLSQPAGDGRAHVPEPRQRHRSRASSSLPRYHRRNGDRDKKAYESLADSQA